MIGVADGQAFEVVVVGGHHVEQVVRAVAVEDRLTVARAFDHDRSIGGAALGQEVGPARDSALPASSISVTVVLVDAGVHHDRVARLNARRKRVEVI